MTSTAGLPQGSSDVLAKTAEPSRRRSRQKDFTMKLRHHWTRLGRDANGNSRWCVHYLALVPDHYLIRCQHCGHTPPPPANLYDVAVKRANQIGGRKYNCRRFGGGIAFYTCCLQETEAAIGRVIAEAIAAKITN